MIVFIFIILIWRTYLFIQSYKQTGQISKVGPLDLVADMMQGDTISLIMIPGYLFFANSFNVIKSEFVLIRIHSRSSLWNNEMLAFGLSAFIFSFLSVTATYILGGLMIKSFVNHWQDPSGELAAILAENSSHLSVQSFLYTSPSVLLIYVVYMTLGLCCIGFVFAVMKLLIKNTPLVFVLLVVIIMIDSYSSQLGILSPYLMLDKLGFLNPFSILGNALITFSVILCFSFIGKKLMNRHDFLFTSKKGNRYGAF